MRSLISALSLELTSGLICSWLHADDTLLGHGMLLIEMYLWGLPGVTQMHCEFE